MSRRRYRVPMGCLWWLLFGICLTLPFLSTALAYFLLLRFAR